MALLQSNVGLVVEVEVVPGDLIAEHGGPLEGTESFRRDDLMVLMDVVEARHEDRIGLPFLSECDEELENVLPVLGERADLEVVKDEAVFRDADLGCSLPHFL